jgi:hypothetical protein
VDFGNRDLARLGVAKLGVSFSSWCFAITLGVYGFEVGGAVAVGLIALIRLMPGALASPFAGLLGDRFSRRAVLVASSLAIATVLAGATIAAAFDASAAVVFSLAGVFTFVASAYVPAEAALLPVLAQTPQELSAANVTHSAMDNGGFLVAALTTGVLLAVATPPVVFGVAAAVAMITAVVLAGIARDPRPAYAAAGGGILRDTALGFRALTEQPGLRVLGAMLILLALFEGIAEVLVVILALDLLSLGEGSVGYLNAGWGVGALVGGAALVMLVDRRKLAVALAVGSLVVGAATALPGAWPVPAAAYAGWIGIGIGYTLVEVAAKTLLQRLGSDETLGRLIASLEATRLAAMGVGSISAAAIVHLLGTRGTLIAVAALLPLFVLSFWTRLRGFEVGAPVAAVPYALVRANAIFAPLPVATLERISYDLAPVHSEAGEDVITQGEYGNRFYLIESGEVEVLEDGVFRRTEGPGESFGEIALLRDVPRTATVRATAPSRLLALEREQFIAAVTGHRRSHQLAHTVVDSRWSSSGSEPPAEDDRATMAAEDL